MDRLALNSGIIAFRNRSQPYIIDIYRYFSVLMSVSILRSNLYGILLWVWAGLPPRDSCSAGGRICWILQKPGTSSALAPIGL